MTFTDIAELKIRILGQDAVKTFDALNASAKDVKDQLKEMELMGKKNTEEYKALARVQRDIQQELKKTTQGIDIQNASMRELEALMRRKNQELKNLKIGSAEWIAKLKEIEPIKIKIDETNDTIRSVGKSTNALSDAWGRVKDVALGALAALSLDNLISETINFVKTGIKGAADLSDAFAKIQKTTGMTKDEVVALNDSVKKIDTRTAQNDLLKIGEVGGQIGVAKNEMLGFVEATDKAVVALGDEFSGGAEEVTKKLAPLKTLFKETKDLEFGTAVNKIGSALNELGAAGTATGPVVAEFAARMGQLGDLSPQISQVLGLGASFQELGLTAEISSGGLSNILLGAAKATELFSKQVGLTEQAFKKLINTNPNEVLLKLAESFRGMPTDKVVKQLDDLGIKSQEATKVMSLLKDQTDLVREKQDLANRAMAEGTSLTKEFNIVNNTEAAQLEKAQKALENKRVELGQKLLPTYIAVTKAGGAFTGFLAENGALILKAGTWIAAYVGLQKIQIMWTERQVLLEGVKNATAKVGLVLQGQQILAAQAQTGSLNVLTAAETRAVAAANAFNTALQRNAIILAATVVIAGLKAMYDDYAEAVEVANSMSLDHIKKTDESIVAERKHAAEMKISIERAEKLAYGTKERKEEIEKIMKVYPQYFKNMTSDQVSNWHLEQALKGVNAELERKIELMSREKRVGAMTDRASALKAELEGLGVYAKTLTEYNKTAKESFSDGFKHIRGKLMEYESIMFKIGKAQGELTNTHIKNYNFEAKAINERYKNGKLTLQQAVDEIKAIQDKHNIFVKTYNKEIDFYTKKTAAHAGGQKEITNTTKEENEKRTAAEKKAAKEIAAAHKAMLKEIEKANQLADNTIRKSLADNMKAKVASNKAELDASEKLRKELMDNALKMALFKDSLEKLERIKKAKSLEEIEKIESEYKDKALKRELDYSRIFLERKEKEFKDLKKLGALTKEEEDKRAKELLVLRQDVTDKELAIFKKGISDKQEELKNDKAVVDELWDQEVKAYEKKEKDKAELKVEIIKQVGSEAKRLTNEFLQNTIAYYQKEVDAADGAMKKFFAQQKLNSAKNTASVISGAVDVASGEYVAGSIKIVTGIVKFFDQEFNAYAKALEARAAATTERIKQNLDTLLPRLQATISGLEGIENTYKKVGQDPFKGVTDSLTKLNEIYATLLANHLSGIDKMTERANNSALALVDAEIKIGDQIISNWELATDKQNKLFEEKKSLIQKTYDDEISKINQKYDYESIKLNQQFDAESLAITEGVNNDLMAFVTNQDLKLGLTSEYERRRGDIAKTFALAYKPITEGMTEAEIKGINDAKKARDEAFAKLADWQTGQIKFVIDHGKLERDTFTDTQKIIEGGKEAQYQLSLKYKAAEIKNEIDRNAEKDAADAVRKKSLLAAETEYNATITALNLAKDVAIAASMERLKNFMITAIGDMQNRYAEMVANGIAGSEAMLESLNRLKNAYYDLYNAPLPGSNDSRGSNTSTPTVNPNTGNTPRFASGTEYLDPNGIYPAGTDKVPIMADRGERIIDKYSNALLGGISNRELVNMVTRSNLYRNGPNVSTTAGMVNLASPASVQQASHITNNLSTTALEAAVAQMARELQAQSKFLEVIADKDPSINFHALSNAFKESAAITARSSF
jgi:TP901 family phage tail tape measure protein